MSTLEDWLRCKDTPHAEFRASGGCTWPLQLNSPGFPLRIPNETRFRIRRDGPKSSWFVSGVCRDGRYEVLEGHAAGRYETASAAVNAVRSHVKASNAYLYIEFEVGRDWILADELRRSGHFGVPADVGDALFVEAVYNVKMAAGQSDSAEAIRERYGGRDGATKRKAALANPRLRAEYFRLLAEAAARRARMLARVAEETHECTADL